jgi:hypothetical protein
MAVAYVLFKVEYVANFNPNELLTKVEADQNIQSAKIVDVDTPNGRESTPYIGF